jgi:transposase
VYLVSEATNFEERLRALEVHANARIAKLEHERDEYKKLTLLLQEQVERLKRGLLGQKAERLPKNDAQLSLAILNLALGGDPLASPPAAPQPEQTVPAHTRRKPVRKPLPDTLPRVTFEILPPEVQREGLDAFEFRRR